MKILILGIGNLLMGDEGVGVHFIRVMEREELPPNVSLLDGGTGGFHLMEYLEEHPIVIMVDATLDGRESGTIELRTPRFSKDFPKALSSHDIGLKDLIQSLYLVDKAPKIYLFTVSIEDLSELRVTLSPEVEAVIPVLVEKCKNLIKKLSS